MRKRWMLLVVPALALMATPCAGATVAVTSTTDVSDGATSSISALIANPGPDGVISLREAMTAANSTFGADTISFNIAGSGVKTIFLLTSKLPPITEAVTIDGYTQPGASPNTLAVGDNAVLRIEVTGNILPVPQLGTGLELDADDCVIKGLVINQFGGYSIPLSPNKGAVVIHGTGNVIAGNFIGTNATGTAYAEVGMNTGRTNWVGISISGASSGNTTIGGSTPEARNIITGNRTALNIQNSPGNVVAGNFIGTDINGAPMIFPVPPNFGSLDGPIRIFGASNNTIGGTVAGAGNLTTVGVNLVNDAVSSPPSVLVPHNNLILGNSFLSGGHIRFVATPTNPGEDVDYNSGGANVSQDPLDADAGPNGLQNSPTILSATVAGATTSVTLRLTTAANQTYRVEVYSDAGRTLLGTLFLTTDGAGFAQTVLALPAVAAGQWVSATASGPDGTSESSVPRVVQDPAAAGLPMVVTHTNDSGAGSLRQAIFNANVQINSGTPDVITFNIPGASVHTIQPTSALPVIGEGVLIDGYSQPGSNVNTLATGNSAVLLIELSGESLSAASNTLLAVLGSDTTIRGLVMNRAGAGSSGSGTTLALGPLASNVKIEGSFIGTNAAGTAATAYPAQGIFLDNVSNSTIGGTTPAARNLISGNLSGLMMRGPETTGNVIAGNSIGTNASGTAPIPNTVYGLVLGPFAANNLIGGTTAGARNVISGNGYGVVAASNWPGLLYTLGDGNRIQGNYIGTTADGNAALGNGAVGQSTTGGIYVADLNAGAGTLTIGGTAAGAGNLISGNKGSGIVVTAYDFHVPGGTVVVQGNRIGTDAAGTGANANQGDGIFHDFFALKLVVGGTTAAERNIVSGNLGSGISAGSYFGSAIIQGNFIGTDLTGALPLGNGNHGVLAPATGAQIGDPATPGSGNVIAFNTNDGIAVTGDIGNPVSRNSILSNGGLGIDLGSNGVTPNDAGDADTGPNNLQNSPVLTSVVFGGSNATIGGTLNSTASTAFRIELFSNTSCDPSGYGEGQFFLGSTTVITDGSGNGSFNALTFPVAQGQEVIAATATDPSGNTSEFSACSSLAPSLPTLAISSVAANEGNGGPTQFGFTVTLSAASASTVTVDFASADGTATAGSGDYVSTSGTLTFVPGQTSRQITVTVSGDMGVEPVETFFVRLSSPTSATIAVAQGTGTISNDDGAPIPIPTLSEWGMILFGLSILALGTWRLGNHG